MTTAKAVADELGSIARNNSDLATRIAAVRSLGEQTNDYAKEELGSIARNNNSSEVRVAAAEALGRMGRLVECNR